MVRFRSHEVHDGHGTSVMGVDDSGGSFLVPMPTADLKVSPALPLCNSGKHDCSRPMIGTCPAASQKWAGFLYMPVEVYTTAAHRIIASSQDQIITQKDVQEPGVGPDHSTGQNGKLPEVDSPAVELPEKKAEKGGRDMKQMGSFKRAKSKKMDSDGVEQQAGSFTKQLEGYMPRFHWGHQQQAATKSKRVYSLCLNLRDVGANMPALMKPGIVFRSSELLRCLPEHPLPGNRAPLCVLMCALCSGRGPGAEIPAFLRGHSHAPSAIP